MEEKDKLKIILLEENNIKIWNKDFNSNDDVIKELAELVEECANEEELVVAQMNSNDGYMLGHIDEDDFDPDEKQGFIPQKLMCAVTDKDLVLIQSGLTVTGDAIFAGLAVLAAKHGGQKVSMEGFKTEIEPKPEKNFFEVI